MAHTVVVTGGSGGIGLAVVERLLADPDVSVAIVDRDAPAPLAPGRWEFFACDVSDPGSVGAAHERIAARLPPVRGLVNGAGIVHNVASLEVGLDTIHRMFAVHVDGTVLWSQAVAPAMIAAGAGAIVNIGSIAGLFGHPRRLAYAAAKAAIHSITKTLAVEWAGHGIRVNAVAPGYIATPMMVEVTRIGLVDGDTAAGYSAMKRLGEPAEVADTIIYLLSDHASFITGSVLQVDGGFSVLKVE